MEGTQTDILERLDSFLAKAEQPAPLAPRFLDVTSAARYTSLSPASIRRLLSAGTLTALRPLRGKVLIDRQQLDTVILSATSTTRTGRGRTATKRNRTRSGQT